MPSQATRRAFLLTAPLAALSFESLAAQANAPATEPFKLLTSKQLDEISDKLGDRPGNQDLYAGKTLPFTFVMTTEEQIPQGKRVARASRPHRPDSRRRVHLRGRRDTHRHPQPQAR